MRSLSLVALAVLLCCAPAALANIIEVEGPQDSLAQPPEDFSMNHCTFRKAIVNANTDTAAYPQCASGSGLDTIVFLSPMTVTMALTGGSEDAAHTGDFDITDSVIIDGGGSTIDAASLDRIFHVNPSGAHNGITVTITNLNIRNGRGLGMGGAILVEGAATLNLTNVTISNSYVFEGDGGAIAMTNGDGTPSLTVNMLNCTLVGNHSAFHAGAITNETGYLNITSSTIAGNYSDTGLCGGLRTTGITTLRNSIVAMNTNISPLNYIPNLDGTFASTGYNVIGDLGAAPGNPTFVSSVGDQVGVTNAELNLGPLQDNGGPVLTRELLSGSVAIDKGHSSGSTADARGLTRPCDLATIGNATGGDGADAGAFEVQGTCGSPNSPPSATDDSYSMNQDTTLNVAAAGVLSNDSDPDNDTLSAVLVIGAAHGTVALNADGSFSYTPAAHYIGSDSFTYKANDGAADSNVATVTITVLDTEPPAISLSVATPLLWPPDHSLIDVGLAYSATDNGGSATTSVSVFSDEDDVTPANGDQSPDAKSAGSTLRLRAERDATSDGRVYLIRVTSTDASSNTSHKCVTVVVPRSMSAADVAAVNAQAAAAQLTCSGAGLHVVGDGPVVGPKQ